MRVTAMTVVSHTSSTCTHVYDLSTLDISLRYSSCKSVEHIR